MHKTKVLQNDAFSELCKITKVSHNTLARRIVNRFTAEELIDPEEKQHCGRNVIDVAQDSGYLAEDVIAVLFPKQRSSTEIPELLNVIYFMGNADDYGDVSCNECRCEMEINDHDWNDQGDSIDIYKCTNESCGNEETFINEDEPLCYKSSM